MSSVIAELHKHGFVVHPLSKPDDKGNSPGKRPLLSKWQNLTKTPDNIDDYIKNGCNLGLVCGKASNVTVIDHDHFLFAEEIYGDFELNTLRSARTPGRGHTYFQYNPDLPAQKHHDLGIEILSDGSNAVIPPSIHSSGDIYRWNDLDTPIIQMPKKLEENLKRLFKTEAELKQMLGKCRKCFRDMIKHKPNVHGAEGREYMLAVCTDLKARGAKEVHIKMFAKLMYGSEYDEGRTMQEWNNIDAAKTWQCETLKNKLPAYVNLNKCQRCDDAWERERENDKETVHENQGKNTASQPQPQPQTKELPLKDIIALNKEEQERKLQLSLPEDHFISQCVKWLNSINDGYQEYKIISAFWILSALTSNKIVLKLKQGAIRPNIWVCVLGKSTTSRKSTVVNACRGVYEAATDHILYNDDYSIEGYLETLSLNPVLHNVRDEVAGLMAKFHKKYNEGIFELECAVYDCQNIKKTLSGGKSKEPKTFIVNDPYVTKLYATTPDNFSRYMTVDDFTCGYGFRFLFSHPKYNRTKMALELEEEEDITAWASVLASIKRIHRYFLESDETSFKVEPEAMKYYNKILRGLEERAEESNNDFLGAAIGRNQGHILKLALLIEIGGKVNAHTISYNSMVLACDMVTQYFLPEILDVIDRLQDDVKMYQVEKVSTTLRRKGGVMTHSQLLHDTKLKSKEFAECIATLIESRTIEPIKEEKTKLIYYRMLNHNNSKILQIPQIPRILLFSQGIDTQENLENLKELEKLDDTRARVCRAPRGLGLLREWENSENLENSGNQQLISNNPNQPEQPFCQCGHPESYHAEDGCMGDGGFCECTRYQDGLETQKSPNNLCYLCGKELLESQPVINFGAGMGDVHESCINTQDKALHLLKKKYDNYRPGSQDEMARRIEGMNGYLSEEIENISNEGVELVIRKYCKDRGWNMEER